MYLELFILVPLAVHLPWYGQSYIDIGAPGYCRARADPYFQAGITGGKPLDILIIPKNRDMTVWIMKHATPD